MHVLIKNAPFNEKISFYDFLAIYGAKSKYFYFFRVCILVVVVLYSKLLVQSWPGLKFKPKRPADQFQNDFRWLGLSFSLTDLVSYRKSIRYSTPGANKFLEIGHSKIGSFWMTPLPLLPFILTSSRISLMKIPKTFIIML